MGNAINWFEIPSTDFERAVAFYSTVLGAELRREAFMGVPHGFIAGDKGEPIGAVIAGPTAEGSEATVGVAGPILYLNAGRDLDGILARIPEAGGKVLTPATPIGPQGHIAIFVDSEGNRLGLHQPPM